MYVRTYVTYQVWYLNTGVAGYHICFLQHIAGVRTYKILLPPGSERDRLTLTTDKNAWAGVPVGIAKRRPPPRDLGPPPRSRGGAAHRKLRRSSGGEDGEDTERGGVVTKYNWLPTPLVAGVELLQTPIQTPIDSR